MGFIKNYDQLAKTPQRKIVLDLIETAISSIQPENVMGSLFNLQNNELVIKDQKFDLKNFENVYLIGFGKGSARISKIIEEKLEQKLTEGYVIDVTSEQFSKIELTIGTHPVVSQTNIDFTKKVVDRFSNLSKKDLVLVVVAGGGSALFELPKEISTGELIKVYENLQQSGKNIEEMNKERTRLSKVKGGDLARILSPAKIVGLIFSDVPGNDLSTVASGPTDDPRATNILILSNKTALDAMKKKTDELNINAQIYFDEVQGEAKVVGAELLKATKPNSILLAAGETTVKVSNKNGKGGRNQELVLGALLNIDKNTTIASFDSDGWDNTEFAGAIGDSQTLRKAKELNLDIQKFLDESNSFEFFTKVGDGIQTSRLPSNVSDIMIVLKKPQK